MLKTDDVNTCPQCGRSYAQAVRFCPADGTLMATVVDPFLGRTLMGQFRLVAVAGRGAMGTVYRAEQANVGRTVAVKVLRVDFLRDEGALQRFLREAQAAARLTHPNIVSVHLVGDTEEGVPFIVMEYVEGQTLGTLCDRLGTIEPRRALRIARQIASALADAHAMGIVHRDLKADNILLQERARRATREGDLVKVLDFGIAKLLSGEGGEIAQLTRDGTIFGTPHYIAPEQAAGLEVDGRADLYSLGVILFRMVTGALPFDGTSGMQVLMRHVREEPPRPRGLRPEIPEALEALILRALRKPREERFPDAEHFIEAIDEVDREVESDPGRTLMGLSAPGRSGPTPAGAPAPLPPLPADPNATARMTPVAGSRPLRTPVRASTPPRAPAALIDDPTATRAGEPGLDAWSAQPPPEPLPGMEEYEDDPAARRRRRGLRLAAVAGALLVTGGAIAWQWRPATAPGSAGPASSSAVAPAEVVAAAPTPLPAPLIDEHQASSGSTRLRAGFETPPALSSTAPLRLLLEDAGSPVRGAAVEVEVRHFGQRFGGVVLARDDGDRYRAGVAFGGPGRYAVRAVAVPPGSSGRKVSLDFEVELQAPRSVAAAGAPAAPAVVGRSPPPESQRPAHSRRGSVAGAAASGGAERDEDLPLTVLPGSSTISAPMVPRALGPAPDAVPAPSPAAAPPRPAPSVTRPRPRRADDSSPPPASDDGDPYQMLRDAR